MSLDDSTDLERPKCRRSDLALTGECAHIRVGADYPEREQG